MDFHTYAPDLIAEIDRLYIEALGLPLEPLLTHLKDHALQPELGLRHGPVRMGARPGLLIRALLPSPAAHFDNAVIARW